MLPPSDRAGLKAHAKAAMRSVSPNIYLVSLVLLLLVNAPTVVTEGPTIRMMVNANSLEQAMEIYNSSALRGGTLLRLAILVMNIFLSLVQYGYQLYALRASRGEETGGLETLFSCFRQLGRFLTAELLMFLFTWLWTMLFIIPGLVATLSYSRTIYIMLDDPDISPLAAITASKEMMRGHKAEYFVLRMSFLGWLFLSLFTFGLLDIWLTPYQMVTDANYYNALIGWSPLAPEEPGEPEFTVDDWWKQ